ncbi:hypothetical protein QF000_002464 [Paraburkholderia atlantica]
MRRPRSSPILRAALRHSYAFTKRDCIPVELAGNASFNYLRNASSGVDPGRGSGAGWKICGASCRPFFVSQCRCLSRQKRLCLCCSKPSFPSGTKAAPAMPGRTRCEVRRGLGTHAMGHVAEFYCPLFYRKQVKAICRKATNFKHGSARIAYRVGSHRPATRNEGGQLPRRTLPSNGGAGLERLHDGSNHCPIIVMTSPRSWTNVSSIR